MVSNILYQYPLGVIFVVCVVANEVKKWGLVTLAADLNAVSEIDKN